MISKREFSLAIEWKADEKMVIRNSGNLVLKLVIRKLEAMIFLANDLLTCLASVSFELKNTKFFCCHFTEITHVETPLGEINVLLTIFAFSLQIDIQSLLNV